jgi:hypothetical protein
MSNVTSRLSYLPYTGISYLSRSAVSADFTDQIKQLATQYGARPHEFQYRLHAEAKLASRQAHAAVRPVEAEPNAAELEPDIMEALLANLNLVDYNSIVEAILQTMLSYDQKVWEQEMKRYLASQYGNAYDGTAIKVETVAADISAQITQQQQINPLANMIAQAVPPAQIEPQLDVNAILSNTVEFTPEESSKQIVSCMIRILDMETYFRIPSSLATSRLAGNDTLAASRFGWMLMVVRLVTRSGEHTEFLKMRFLAYILQDFKARMDLALLWLHEEYYQDECHDIQADSVNYNEWCKKILDALRDGLETGKEEGEVAGGLDPKDRSFTRFLVEIPVLGDFALNRIKEYCVDPERLVTPSNTRMLLGIATLRDLMVFRPAVRQICTDSLLDYCLSMDKETRSTAVNSAIMFVPMHKSISPVIEDFAFASISSLADTESLPFAAMEIKDEAPEDHDDMDIDTNQEPLENEIKEEAERTISEDIVKSRSDLFLACCSKKQELLVSYSFITLAY